MLFRVNMNLKLLVLIFCVFFNASLNLAQTVDRVVAKIGDQEIFESEFSERYELTPSFNKQRKTRQLSAKLDFLYTLIAEKLWAKQADEKFLFSRPEVKLAINSIEDMYARDALYRIEIKDKVNITEEEKAFGLIKNAKTLYLRFIFTREKEAILKLENLLREGINFHAILNERPEKDEQIKPIEISFGQMQEDVENEVFNLKKGEYTKPLITQDGWYIFYLENFKEKIFSTSADKEDAINNVIKIIKKRKEDILFKEFYSKFFKGKKANSNGKLFEELITQLSIIFNDKIKISNKKEPDDLFHLSAYDVLTLESYFGAQKLNNHFIDLDENFVTLGKFIRDTVFDGLSIEKQYVRSIRNILDERVKKYIEFAFLNIECTKRGINLLPQVQSEVKMWKDNYLQQALKSEFLQTNEISDSIVHKYYQDNYKSQITPIQLKIIEIFTTKQSLLPVIQEAINRGEDFKVLARKYGEKESLKSTDGESDFFPINSNGEIGKIAGKMSVGDTFGPLNVKRGFSFIKLIDKKDSVITPPSKSFEEVKITLERELKEKQLKSNYINYTVDLAKKYDVKINLEILNDIDVTTLNTFGIRYMGFGGKITAVPLLAPFTEWVEKYKLINKELP